jgi:sporulation protein YlmC with PRC-barrel domain
MSERIVYVSRITRLPLVGADGSDVGHVVDVVLDLGGRPPRVVGFVVGGVQRRRVFVGVTRISEIDTRGLRLRRGTINLKQFELRAGERLVIGELLGKRVGARRVVDIGLRPAPTRSSGRWPPSHWVSGGCPG